MSENGFFEELIIAGFGGQGIILVGKLLAQTAMQESYEVTYIPSYGAEVRGGTANCMVVMAAEPIASPIVGIFDTAIVLNKASFDKFVSHIKPGGLLVLNSSMIDENPNRDDIEILSIPADDIAVELNSPKSTNMVILGAYLQKRGLIPPTAAACCLADVLAPRYHKTIPINEQAIKRGAEFAQNFS